MGLAQSFDQYDYFDNLLNNYDENNKDNDDFKDMVDLFFKRPIKPNTKLYTLPDKKEWWSEIKKIFPMYEESDKLPIPLNNMILTWKYNDMKSTVIPTKEELMHYITLMNEYNNNMNPFENFSNMMALITGDKKYISFYVKDIVAKDEYSIIPLCCSYNDKTFPLELRSIVIVSKEEWLIGSCYTRDVTKLSGLRKEISLPGILGDDREEIKGDEKDKVLKIFKDGFLYLVVTYGLNANSISYYDNGILIREISSAFNSEEYREYHNNISHGIDRYLIFGMNIELNFDSGYLKGPFSIKLKDKSASGFIGDNKYYFPGIQSLNINKEMNDLLLMYSDVLIGKYKYTSRDARGEYSEKKYYNNEHQLHGIIQYKYGYSLNEKEIKKLTGKGIHKVSKKGTIIKRFYVNGKEYPLGMIEKIKEDLRVHLKINDLVSIVNDYLFY
ncbi:MAG: hypothetical protein Solumvirus1_47 [Solumvirus sp.]|uniref:Uncharacterized protein n=1 Tax=Solumvirus sp. TaxID=2487773 RepID=A0A3G5AG78_9VIRU|nr:MAG: hypothetical protein Solumvirus1_47 [Solumvirus sp.]